MNHLFAPKRLEAFRDTYESFKELEVKVIGISSQDVDSHKSFAKRHRLPFILLSDPENKVRKLFGIASTLGVVPGRATFVINKEVSSNSFFLHSGSLQNTQRKPYVRLRD